jgi:hypothetical protein
MITFSTLGKKGNLGNQMFQIASTSGLALKNNQDFSFPKWEYSQYFQKEFPEINKNESFQIVKEKSFKYNELKLEYGNYDLEGWFQSEKYFNQKNTKELFFFEEKFIISLLNEQKLLFNKKTILISIRRGDFINHPYYFQLTFKFYLLALLENFPDWEERNLIFTSDDILYCKYHFSFLKNAFFLDELSAIEQLALGSQCDDFVISNSTFSWWIAWLGEKENSKIIRPSKNFRGEFAIKNDDSDYFPSRWISFDDNSYSLSWRYSTLKVRAFLYDLVVNTKYRYSNFIKTVKNNVKWLLLLLKLHKRIEPN